MRDVNKSLQLEVDDLKQKLNDANGDIKVSCSSGSKGGPGGLGPLPLLKLVKKRWPPSRVASFASHRGPPGQISGSLLSCMQLMHMYSQGY